MDAVADKSPIATNLSNHSISVDCIYLAASACDSRFTRICVASIRYFYPDVPIRLLAGGPLQPGLLEELGRYWNVEVANFPVGDYGWGFVKLEPLFGMQGAKFLVLDSDTVITGPILGIWGNSNAPFLVDDEVQSETNTKRLYYDWKKLYEIDPQARPPAFVFNSGQWFGTQGILNRGDFALWVEWSMPRQLRHPTLFMPGDQGILNYVLNQKAALEGLPVERKQIMRWPGHSMNDLDAEVVSKRMAPALVIHWAGMKKFRLRNMIGGDILLYFEKYYYSRVPAGGVRRLWANCRDTLSRVNHWIVGSIRLTYQKRIVPVISWRLSRRAKPSEGV
jgi:hypothetical protein